ncbi:MAG TPA: polysaccharide biosynthesis/export family protein [Thiobacillaceae bacterium]|nr:polysaccharide biosynthesis/export family protein [Thiobacillaceae bacterium]HNU64911.1 polysaccharide biosynthesis/export family protein [Thiobacillaceae bacterium]
MKRYLLPIALASLLSACAQSPVYPPAPASAANVPDWMYLLGPGDSVNVFVWGNPEVSGNFPIRPDGMMTMNLVEDLPASGKTPTQLAREIEKILGRYIQDPIVTVIVAGGVGPYSEQIRVLGQAAKPQTLVYRQGMSLVDVMITVGGISDFAAGNKASILRIVDGKPQQFSVRLEDLVKDGDISANVEMRPGDLLIIPESFF